jgi:methylated-DNA-[protein]-cysteine S-methyltransferase
MQSQNEIVELPIATRDGMFVARYSARGLAALEFPSAAKPRAAATLPRDSARVHVRRWHALATKALKSALAGRQPENLPPLDFSIGTAFQQSVWKTLGKIAPGKTRSYGEIALAIGNPGAARAVGQACGANPIPVLIPCHRVLAAGGDLGGFSAGLELKRTLLARESVS